MFVIVLQVENNLSAHQWMSGEVKYIHNEKEEQAASLFTPTWIEPEGIILSEINELGEKENIIWFHSNVEGKGTKQKKDKNSGYKTKFWFWESE